ncbi:MAG: S8 family serine peptidase [Segetibacter sp.]
MKKVVKVAVFDTGIDPVQLSKYSYNSFGRSCIKGASAGYNFINPGFSFIDDDPKKHGTIVTHLITEQVNKYRNNKVEILSVKTHDANGIGDLYRILCAFAYAQQMGVQIINASFGFYSPQRKLVEEADPAAFKNALLLRNYIKHYLTRNSILLITAAGNEDDENEKSFDDSGLQDFYPKNHRDLDEVAFLPASFARSPELPNVIAVTTVHINKRGKGTVSPDQNFSEHVVDIGVKADALTDDNNYGFQTPVLANGEVAVGSSFAAPIVTGILCAHYDKIITLISKGNFKKDDLWKILEPQIVRREPSLKDKINEGRVMERLR